MALKPAPITNPVVDENRLPTLSWTLFFNQNFQGDAGDVWEPTFTSLTGSLTSITGKFYRLSQYLVYFVINVVPSGATSSTAGTTYIGNFPLSFKNDGFNTVVSGATGGAIGMNRASDNRIYVPAWTSVSSPLVIMGIVEAT